MALTPQQRKRLLGHGGLTRAQRRARRSLSHMSVVNNGHKRDAVAERAIARLIVEQHPDVSEQDVFPPMPTTTELLEATA